MPKGRKIVLGCLYLSVFCWLGASEVHAEQKSLQQDSPPSISTVYVIGSKALVKSMPGSATYISVDEIRTQNYDDINEVLRKVPGVYLREEEGYGLFPNISIRGVAPGRSEKVTIMEDGILMAPAPYSAPAAYYSPKIGRMHGIEVLKGSSQIQYGPHTTGGVINYISTPIPEEQTMYLKSDGGSFGERKVHVYTGGTDETSVGKVGHLIEFYYRGTDGFRSIDKVPDNTDRDNTGFDLFEPMIKLSWEPESDKYQYLELKFGWTHLDANVSYLGLTDADFRDNPFRRYAASRFDNFVSDHLRTSLSHVIEINENLDLATTLYFNYFHRDWFKLRGDGTDLLDPAQLAIWKGQAAGTLRYRHNNRYYASGGVQTVATSRFETGPAIHELDLGFRYHNDRIRRDQENVTFTQAADGSITDSVNGGQGSGGDRIQVTDAFALHVKDTIEIDKWTLTPGFRYEHLDQSFKDFNSGESGTGDMSVWTAGLGINYEVNEAWNVFGGVHRGVSTPSPRDHIRSGLKEEISLGGELGGRFDNANGLAAEIVLFYTDFDNLIVSDNIGGGGSGDSENVGDVFSRGVEARLELDPGVAFDWGFQNPYYIVFTYTNAELDSDANSTDSESIFAGGFNGADVPYVPPFQFAVGTGIETEKWGIFVDVTIVDDVFTTASNTGEQVNPDGVADARFGKTDSYYTIDISAHYQMNDTMKVFANLQNVTDEEYIVSRHPIGPRPGRPFTATAGVELVF